MDLLTETTILPLVQQLVALRRLRQRLAAKGFESPNYKGRVRFIRLQLAQARAYRQAMRQASVRSYFRALFEAVAMVARLGKPSHDQYEALARELATQHPDHRLTFGYIGNLERWGDDRAFYVFSRYNDNTGRSAMFYLGGFKALDFTDRKAQALRTWAAHLSDLCQRGQLHARG